MEKKHIIDVFTTTLAPLGLVRRGNRWVYSGDVLDKIVFLDRSNYSNKYYIDLGLIIKNLDPGLSRAHISRRLGSTEVNEHLSITDVLDLENDMSDEDREKMLKSIIMDKITPFFEQINTEQDLLKYIKTLPTLNIVPLSVKQYFGLPKNKLRLW